MILHVRPLTDLIGALLGPTVWAGHFFLLYGAEALLCTKGASLVGMRLFAAVATAVAIGILLAAFVWGRRVRGSDRPMPALREISNMLSLISIGAILAVAWPASMIPNCANPAG